MKINKINIIKNFLIKIIQKKIKNNEDNKNYIFLHNFFIKYNYSLSVAESCTGGLLSNNITNFSNSSKYFKLGLIVYSNKSKIKLLKINKKKLKKYGAVSEEIAKDMIISLKNIYKTDICVIITGIAGPKGGSIEKPIGLVYIGFYIFKKYYIEKKYFTGKREEIKKKIVDFVFLYLLKKINKEKKNDY